MKAKRTAKTKAQIDRSVNVDRSNRSQIVIQSKKVKQTMKSVDTASDEIAEKFAELYEHLDVLQKKDPRTATRIRGVAQLLESEVQANPEGAAPAPASADSPTPQQDEAKPEVKEEDKGFWRTNIKNLVEAAAAAKSILPDVWDTAKDLAEKLSGYFGTGPS